MIRIWSVESDPAAQGRLEGARPVAVLDIGSNSIRLIVYERHARALTALYNEKSASALGRGVSASGRLSQASMDKALRAIQRFALVCRLNEVETIHAIATSAVREASNGPEFARRVEEVIDAPVLVLSGEEEARFAALGALSGMPDFKGVVGDLGGGSLELAVLDGADAPPAETHGLGVIRLQDDSEMDLSRAAALARERLAASGVLRGVGKGATFCAVGGTWRALATLHHTRRKYPLHMVQGYMAESADLLALCEEVVEAGRADKEIAGIKAVSGSRRSFLPYAAAVMAEILETGRFQEVVFSALGIREGYLYDLLPPEEQAVDPLIQATGEMSLLRSRAPAFAAELIATSGQLLAALGIAETPEDRRLREAACYISDIGWRAHPDYRGEQSVDMIAFSDFIGVDHPGRAFLAQTVAFRYMGLKKKSASEKLLALAKPRLTKRARLIGAFFRVAYPLAAAMPGILPRISFSVSGRSLVLNLPADLAFLDGERMGGRLKQLAGEAGLARGRVAVG